MRFSPLSVKSQNESVDFVSQPSVGIPCVCELPSAPLPPLSQISGTRIPDISTGTGAPLPFSSSPPENKTPPDRKPGGVGHRRNQGVSASAAFFLEAFLTSLTAAFLGSLAFLALSQAGLAAQVQEASQGDVQAHASPQHAGFAAFSHWEGQTHPDIPAIIAAAANRTISFFMAISFRLFSISVQTLRHPPPPRKSKPLRINCDIKENPCIPFENTPPYPP